MNDFITSLLAVLITIPIIGASIWIFVRWLKKYDKYIGFKRDGSFFEFVVLCLLMLFAVIKVMQFIGTHFMGIEY